MAKLIDWLNLNVKVGIQTHSSVIKAISVKRENNKTFNGQCERLLLVGSGCIKLHRLDRR